MRTHEHREGSTTDWGLLEGIGEGQRGGGSWGGIAWGEKPNVDEGEEGSKTHCHVCTYAAIGSSHVPQNLKGNKKKEDQ